MLVAALSSAYPRSRWTGAWITLETCDFHICSVSLCVPVCRQKNVKPYGSEPWHALQGRKYPCVLLIRILVFRSLWSIYYCHSTTLRTHNLAISVWPWHLLKLAHTFQISWFLKCSIPKEMCIHKGGVYMFMHTNKIFLNQFNFSSTHVQIISALHKCWTT